jgi:hypothetical protein
MLLGGRRESVFKKVSDKKVIYSFSEDEYINYMNKLYLDKQAADILLFGEPCLPGDDSVKALLCEQYTACFYFEKLLEELEDTFVAKDGMFYLDNKQATRFTLLLFTLAQVKEELLKNTVSLSYH